MGAGMGMSGGGRLPPPDATLLSVGCTPVNELLLIGERCLGGKLGGVNMLASLRLLLTGDASGDDFSDPAVGRGGGGRGGGLGDGDVTGKFVAEKLRVGTG